MTKDYVKRGDANEKKIRVYVPTKEEEIQNTIPSYKGDREASIKMMAADLAKKMRMGK